MLEAEDKKRVREKGEREKIDDERGRESERERRRGIDAIIVPILW